MSDQIKLVIDAVLESKDFKKGVKDIAKGVKEVEGATKQKNKTVGDMLKNLKAGWLAVGAAVAGAVKFLRDATKAWADKE